jgi:hypothetical protein
VLLWPSDSRLYGCCYGLAIAGSMGAAMGLAIAGSMGAAMA